VTVIPTVADHPDFTQPPQFTADPVIAGAFTATATSGPLATFYCGNMESIVVRATGMAAGVGWVYNFTWYADQALTQQIGQTNLRTLSAIPISAQLPNRGPWCQVTVTTTNVAAKAFTLYVIPRTGTPSGAGSFLDGLIQSAAGQVIAGAGNVSQNAYGLTPGEACITVDTDAAVWSAKLFAFDETSALIGIWCGLTNTGGGAQSQRFILPPYWTRLTVSNGDAGNRTFDWAVQAAL
jgi:hypothetical protein